MKKQTCCIVVIFLATMFCCSSNKKSCEFEYKELDAEHGKNLIADLDGDGRNDIVKIGGQEESVVLYKSNPDTLFTKSVLIRGVHMRGDRVEVSDIDQDGDLDLVGGINENDSLYMTWMKNPQKGENEQWEVVKIGSQGSEKTGGTSYTKDIGIADFNKDGKLDVVTRTNKRTRIFMQNSPADWAEPISLDHHDHEGMDIGDLDGDGDIDIILNGFWFETPADLNGEFKEHVIDDKWFGQTENTWRDDNASVKVLDINGDGLLDVLISHSEKPGYSISIYVAKTHADVKQDKWSEIKIAEVYDFCQTLDAADIDNDGDIDILAAQFERDHQGERWRNYPPFPVSIFWNVDGKGTQWQEELLSEKGMYAGTLGDVGSDGDIDIVAPRSYWTGPTDFYENKLNDK